MAMIVQSFSVSGGDQDNGGTQEWMATITATLAGGETVALSFDSLQQSSLISDLMNTNPPFSLGQEPPGGVPGDPIIGYD